MDNIRQYQKLSDIKPSYQKLTNPLFGVSKMKIQYNNKEFELEYNNLGLWEHPKSENKTKKTKTKGGDESGGGAILLFAT